MILLRERNNGLNRPRVFFLRIVVVAAVDAVVSVTVVEDVLALIIAVDVVAVASVT